MDIDTSEIRRPPRDLASPDQACANFQPRVAVVTLNIVCALNRKPSPSPTCLAAGDLCGPHLLSGQETMSSRRMAFQTSHTFSVLLGLSYTRFDSKPCPLVVNVALCLVPRLHKLDVYTRYRTASR